MYDLNDFVLHVGGSVLIVMVVFILIFWREVRKIEERVINICSNPNCEWPIYKDDEVWKRGSDYFCHIECLISVMKKENS